MTNKNRRPSRTRIPNKHIEQKEKEGVKIDYKNIRLVFAILLMPFALYMFICMLSFLFTGGLDQSIVGEKFWTILKNPDIVAANPTGKLGAKISDVLINHYFGVSSVLLCYVMFITGLRLINYGICVRQYVRHSILGIVFMLWISLLLGFIVEYIASFYDIHSGYLFLGGGHGYFLSKLLNPIAGRFGTLMILFVCLLLIFVFGYRKLTLRFVVYVKLKIEERKERRIREHESRKYEEEETNKDEELDIKEPMIKESQDLSEQKNDEHQDFLTYDDAENSNALILDESDDTNESIPLSIDESSDRENLQDLEIVELQKEEQVDESLCRQMEALELEMTITNDKEEETVDYNLDPTKDYDPTLELSNYQYPSLDLLEEHTSGNPKVTQEELSANKNRIVDTLKNYKIEITKIKATIGPTVTLYEIVPAPGVKISKIKNLEDDIALSLSALGIRIIAPIPGAGTIGIEVPNQNPDVVSMRGIIASRKFQESDFALPIALGRTISNETYTFDLAKMPHLLVAGATGQGKSVGLNAIITSLLYKKHPSQLKFVMVDPKKVELSIYSTIEKHFLAKLPDEEEAIITETSKVVNTLNSLCIEMDSRYDLLKVAQVRNIKEYNEKFVKRRLNPENGHKYLPYIVVVVDEFADLIMTAGKEVEMPIARIAQLARAVGIHMIIATQRPSTNIITGIIKANFPARVAFKVASMIDSRTILDSPGANQLIGRGDMLIAVNSEMTRVQCAFVDTPEIDAITTHIAEQQSYPSAFALPEYIPESDAGVMGGIDLGNRDALFEEAARFIVSSQQGSTSSLQRRFSIGYNRAGKIIDQMEAAGIVGPFEGSKGRQVLVGDETSLERLL